MTRQRALFRIDLETPRPGTPLRGVMRAFIVPSWQNQASTAAATRGPLTAPMED